MKKSEIEKLSLEDLQDKLAEFKKQLSDLKMNQQRDPVLQRLENQIDLMLTRFRQQSQWSSEHG